MITKLVVLLDNETVGHLWLDEKRTFCFQYEKSWAQTSQIPLSLSLPIRDEPYLDDEPHAFFANLLPEQKIREVVARNLGVSLRNDFGLLEKIGGDCAGAVSLYPDGARLSKEEATYTLLTTPELTKILQQLPQRPLLAGELGFRLSLAGAQKKLPVYFSDEVFYLTLGGAPSNYIIKPPMEVLDGTVENEAFCMALAGEIGIDVPSSFICELDGLRVFVIKRYDRTGSNGEIRRLHQEDFCQALSVSPEFKYENEGGPGFVQCVDLLRKKSCRSGKDVLSLIDWLIFNYLVGNSDAHGKNVSFLLVPEGPVLAPFYDLISTRIYRHFGLAEGLAMGIGGENDPAAIQRRHWEALAEELAIKPKFLLSRVLVIAHKIQSVRLKLFERGFDRYKCDSLYRLNELISDSCDKTIRRIS
ncbi:type II toxin-antitoxin system HipA family toxin [Oryzomonas rubra]|uniref:Type II toxin-antitoxin system HipA family toxin n=1 Tax=Oryzomonas rubra TaxID=2509454 RepID=A0A5A9XQ78_9BACT|nr:type II toxin-antitoxin system HipA family toxin [Oryzomonas rubra]KAA0894189.1 type II toxin-antitoxin system HipA family toxin [Oryzomonas rubra]